MLKYSSIAPEIRCEIICPDKDINDVRSVISHMQRVYCDKIPITVNKSYIILPADNTIHPVYILTTKADPQKYVTPHSIEEYNSVAKDMMMDISVLLNPDCKVMNITITNCLTEKYIEKRGIES